MTTTEMVAKLRALEPVWVHEIADRLEELEARIEELNIDLDAMEAKLNAAEAGGFLEGKDGK